MKIFSGGRGEVNYQTQIVTKLPNENIQNYQLEIFKCKLLNANLTKLPNENIQNYQLAMFWGRGGKLPNADCDQTTKWKYPKLPTRNVWIWRGKLPNANCHQTTKWKYQKKLPTRNVQILKYPKLPTRKVGGVSNYQMV